MATRQIALHPVVCAFACDADRLREAFRTALPKARLGFVHVFEKGAQPSPATQAKRKPVPIIHIEVASKRSPGRLLAEALVACANAHYTHLFLVDDPEAFQSLLQAAKTHPDALIEDAKHRLLVFPLERTQRLLDTAAIDMGRSFPIDFKLNWQKDDWPVMTLPDVVCSDPLHPNAFDGFMTKLRFYCRAQASKRPWD